MLSIFMLVAAISIMTKMAIAENRSPFIWGFITFVLCFGFSSLIGVSLFGVPLGLAASFVAMFVANIQRGSAQRRRR